ncbi:MAG: 1-deoxy-D-xylulose-5-phosphate synthase [Rickettsiales bacterium]|nr:1-deoxy-D-xylulose-5-phosphate synthase [Pseudomonadota bacterium]MDA0966264.1 1-deoxy-D-xylulose-5-phosphate synthase [Pseudomonadota bacterium]MDG4543071.1 1-deoxy-D-xylulose-5-phosphate synthase [Rickettsiales bacterium]MDG4545269.1 1-deoxy-D-xylulose-5-phosphate synthase [Rickettsiales bacterium]MDG4547718.1 1-deoxy-D-xylulose-5-phosphate synthase [Rickettsiales bacterium]
MQYDILSKINDVSDIRTMDLKELETLAQELRSRTIECVSKTGGHLGAGLGVVELTVALHHVFETPKDKLIWDVGHQSYPHKILTDRNDRIETIRQPNGLSGFTKRSESQYDPFGAGHSSTSISAALGMSIARDIKGENFETIAVIGDGAMSAGMAYEAMNNAGDLHSRMFVILNDNNMSIAPPVGAMSGYLSRLISSKPYLTLRNVAKKAVSHLPSAIEKVARKAEQYTKDYWVGGNYFEEMGFYYVGPVDGHNLGQLIAILKNLKNDKSINRPILMHIVTEKGHGYEMPEAKDPSLHAVGKFDLKTGTLKKTKSNAPSYTSVFAKQLIEEAENDGKIVAITAAMPSGTGLDKFAEKFNDRMFDVGIAEQHAVTFAAGLACEGLKPFCAIYSTFLQRAYDQVIHDVAIQKLPVRFAIDRAGLVGADGATHAGSFDIMYLANLPNFVVMAPSNELELARMVKTAAQIDDSPSAIRYPRGDGIGIDFPKKIKPVKIGKGKIIQRGSDIAILSLGTRLEEVKKAAQELQKQDISTTIVDMRFAKPVDENLIIEIAKTHKNIITVEEGCSGGLDTQVNKAINNSMLQGKPNVLNLNLPDIFIDHGVVEDLYEKAGLNSSGIVKSAISLVNKSNLKDIK